MNTKPKPPYVITVAFKDGSGTKRPFPNKKELKEYFLRNTTSATRLGGTFTVTDATGRDVTSEVLT